MSTNNPLASIIPLLFVICLGIVKEAIVEVKRWQEDKKVNKTPCTRVGQFGKEEIIILSEVKVGDIL